jgi:ribonuclease Z
MARRGPPPPHLGAIRAGQAGEAGTVAAVKITFLGTSSGTPTRARNVTAQALSLDGGAMWLLDCGEAAQHQLMRAGLRASRIERILITHLHGDHLYGLPGMLACMGIHERRDPVQLVGPVGLAEFVATVLRLSEATVPFPLEIVELDGPRQLGERSSWSVSAHPLAHRVTCFGYSLREAARPGRFDVAAATALGIPPGRLFGRLQRGETVRLADGREIRPAQVCAPPRPGRHVVLLGDTRDAAPIAEAARGCDLLVREVTYDASRADKAEQWGHSTSVMTGRFAAEVGARTLIITHFSSRFTEDPPPGQLTVADLVAETRRECPGTEVLAADDLWSYAVPFPEERAAPAP